MTDHAALTVCVPVIFLQVGFKSLKKGKDPPDMALDVVQKKIMHAVPAAKVYSASLFIKPPRLHVGCSKVVAHVHETLPRWTSCLLRDS